MQTSNFNPIVFWLALLGFMIGFLAYGYYRGLLWFQQDSPKRAGSWFVTFESRDAASGGWFRRFGRPVLVLFFIHAISYPIVTNLIALSPLQFFIFVFVFYIPSDVIVVIILSVILWRVRKQPVPREVSQDQPDESVLKSD